MIAWDRALVDDHCSSWAIIQMLEWLNLTNARWMVSDQSWKITLRGTHFNLSDHSTPRRPGSLVSNHPQIQGLVTLFGEKHRSVAGGQLRYCPVCITAGLHYRYQQDHRFRKCILHLRVLKSGCLGCGYPTKMRSDDMHGFKCSRCGETLLRKGLPGRVLTPIARADSKLLDELYRWESAARTCSKDFQRAATHAPLPAWDGPSPGTDESLHWYAFSTRPSSRIVSALMPLPVTHRLFPPTPLLEPVRAPLEDPERSRMLQSYHELLRCVARRLRRHYLRHHTQCRRTAMRSVGTGGRGLQPIVSIRPPLCALGQGYALWLLQRRIELRRIERQLVTGTPLATIRPLRLPSLSAAALSYVSCFEEWVHYLTISHRWTVRPDLRVWQYDGIGEDPHWPLCQDGPSHSCPVHFRISNLRDQAHCDHGVVAKGEFMMHRAMIKLRQRQREER